MKKSGHYQPGASQGEKYSDYEDDNKANKDDNG